MANALDRPLAGRARSRLALLLLGTALPACSDSLDQSFGGKTWETPHYSYRYQPGDPMACEAGAEQLERYGALLVGTLGVDPAHWTKSTYYKFKTEQELEDSAQCQATARACATSSDVFAAVPLTGHELTHNVMGKETGTHVQLLLAEGLANAFSCDPGPTPPAADWDFRSFGAPPFTPDQIVHAGRLMLGLLQHVRPRDVLDMLGQIDASASGDTLRQRVLDGWGLDLDTIQAEVTANRLGACVPLFACSGPELAQGSSTLHSDCHGVDPAPLPRTSGPLSLRVTGLPLRLMPCTLNVAASSVARLSPYRSVGQWHYWLPQLTTAHALWFDNAEEAQFASQANVELQSLSTSFAPSCDLAQANSIAGGEQVAIVVTGDAPLLHFPLSLPQSHSLRLSWQAGPDAETFGVPDATVSVAWCSSCAAGVAQGCQTFDRLIVEPQTISIDGTGVLVIRPSAPLKKAAVLELTPL